MPGGLTPPQAGPVGHREHAGFRLDTPMGQQVIQGQRRARNGTPWIHGVREITGDRRANFGLRSEPPDSVGSMKSFAAETLILASAGTVWDIITDAGNYPVWDSGITEVKGEIRHGSKIRVRLCDAGKRTFHLRVRQSPSRRMTWTGGIPLGMLRVDRTFSLNNYTGITHLTVRDTVRGPLQQLLRSAPEADAAVSGFVDEVKFRAELVSFHIHGGVFPDSGETLYPERQR